MWVYICVCVRELNKWGIPHCSEAVELVRLSWGQAGLSLIEHTSTSLPTAQSDGLPFWEKLLRLPNRRLSSRRAGFSMSSSRVFLRLCRNLLLEQKGVASRQEKQNNSLLLHGGRDGAKCILSILPLAGAETCRRVHLPHLPAPCACRWPAPPSAIGRPQLPPGLPLVAADPSTKSLDTFFMGPIRQIPAVSTKEHLTSNDPANQIDP